MNMAVTIDGNTTHHRALATDTRVEKEARDAWEKHRPKSQFELGAAQRKADRDAERASKAAAAKKMALVIHVKSASDLPIADKMTKTSDPYYVMKIPNAVVGEAPHERKSEVITKTLNPTWSQKEEKLPGYNKDDVVAGRYGAITIDIYDWNKVMKHVHLCQATLPLANICISDRESDHSGDYELQLAGVGVGAAKLSVHAVLFITE